MDDRRDLDNRRDLDVNDRKEYGRETERHLSQKTEDDYESDFEDDDKNGLGIALEDPETKSPRGRKPKKEVKYLNKNKETKKEEYESDFEEDKNDDDISIDLDDPEISRATTKIQAGFRGSKARKRVNLIL